MAKRLTPYQMSILRKAEKRRAEIYAVAMSRRGAEFKPNGLPKLRSEERSEIMQIAWDLRQRGLPALGAFQLPRLTPEERSEAAQAGWKTRRLNERKERKRLAERKKAVAAKPKTAPKRKPRRAPANGNDVQQQEQAAA